MGAKLTKIITPVAIIGGTLIGASLFLNKIGVFKSATTKETTLPGYYYFYIEKDISYQLLTAEFVQLEKKLCEIPAIKALIDAKVMKRHAIYFDNPFHVNEGSRSCIGYQLPIDKKSPELEKELTNNKLLLATIYDSNYLESSCKYSGDLAMNIAAIKAYCALFKKLREQKYVTLLSGVENIMSIETYGDSSNYVVHVPLNNFKQFQISTLKAPQLNKDGFKAFQDRKELIKKLLISKHITLAADSIALRINPVSQKEEVLLITRKKETFHGKLAFPGGHVEYGEEPEVAAIRELKEETQLDGTDPILFKVAGKPSRDPRGHVVSTVYVVKIKDPNQKPIGADDAEKAEWLELEEVMKHKDRFAFDHFEILEQYVGSRAKLL